MESKRSAQVEDVCEEQTKNDWHKEPLASLDVGHAFQGNNPVAVAPPKPSVAAAVQASDVAVETEEVHLVF